MIYFVYMDKTGRRKRKFFMVNERTPVWKTALRISVTYLAFGLLWILFSDLAVQTLVSSIRLQNELSIIKGFIYVLLSALIIYLLVAPTLGKISDSEQVIIENRNELKAMAYYDHLTGLSNRWKLLERLPAFLNDSTESESKAIFYIDVDDIKLINDTMGHIFGDMLISRIAQRLSSFLTHTDELYRLGGDEFIILTHFGQISEISAKSTQILELFDDPLDVGKNLIHSTISLGIALYPIHGTDPVELLKCSDIAMYQAKKAGKNRTSLFNINMLEPINERMRIGEYLHQALVNGELEVYYQPQIDIATNRISSFEALLRWTNPILGRVPPDKFIAVAEETHLIIPIGEWVLEQSCRFLVRMHRLGFTALTVSVNISVIQILQETFFPALMRILSDTGLNPACLELEITETILMDAPAEVREHLKKLRSMGIGIALDDFGKGYSSLNYLDQLPITILKVDKSFIDDITESTQEKSITGNIVGIGKKLGLIVIAEGVETQAQLEYLSLRHCDKIQGWIFSKALPADEAEAFAKKSLAAISR